MAVAYFKTNIVLLQIPHTSVEGTRLVKISKRVVVLVGIICAITLVIISTAYFFFPDAFTFPAIESKSKIEISNLKMEPTNNWQSSSIRLIVTNTHNSPITDIGSRLNGLNFGYLKIEIPPGQTQDVILPVNLKINNSTSYDTDLTFTFDDGKYEVYSVFVTPTRYVGAFIITGQSLNVTSNTTTTYSVTLQNTGNIPLLKVKCVIDNYESLQTLPQNLIPKSTATLNFTVPFIPQKGSTYSVTLEATFAEESTFSTKTSYIFS
jgi:hypothetical protein